MSSAGRTIIVAWTLALCSVSLSGQAPAKGSADLDLLMTSRYSFGTPQVVLGERLFSGVGALTDLDLDGFPDIAFGGTFFLETGGTFSRISLDEHLQKKGETRFASPSKNPTHVFPHVVSADLNEDSLPDLIGIGRHGGIAIHLRGLVRKDPAGGAQVLGFRSSHITPEVLDATRVGAVSFSATAIRVLDLDADRHEDLLLAGDFLGLEGFLKASGLLYLRGDGEGNFARPTLLLAGRVLSLEIADLNDDGRLDLVTLGTRGEVSLLTRKLFGGFQVQKVGLTVFPDAESLRVRDVDQDGIEDFILFRSCPKAQCFEVGIYKGLSNGYPGPGAVVRIGLPRKETVKSWMLEDLDGDSYPDLALLCVDSLGRTNLELYAGAKEAPWTIQESRPLNALLAFELGPEGTGYLKFEDLDGDGARDLWVSPVRKERDGLVGILYLKNGRVVNPPVRRLGTSTATGKGAIPRISTAGGLPRVGNQKFAFRLSNIPGDQAPYWLWISHVRMDVHILGMQIKVFPFRTVFVRSIGTGEKGGLVLIPFRIPVDPALVGESFFFQWVFPSKGAKNPLSLARSEALQVDFMPANGRSFLPRLR